MKIQNRTQHLSNLLQIMQELRAPGGCPWDAAQTPESLVPYILEESCELIDAIEDGNTDIILDELGDLLLQVVFLAQIFSEKKLFDFYDVAKAIGEKLLRRHPHVFSQQKILADDELDNQWDTIKKAEVTNNKTSLSDHLPSKLPTLQKTQKMIAKAQKLGFEKTICTECSLSNVNKGEQPWHQVQSLDEETLGNILFYLTHIAHKAGLDAESALRKKNRKVLKIIESQNGTNAFK